MTKKDYQEALVILADALYPQGVTSDFVKYNTGLQGEDLQKVTKAVQHAVKTWKKGVGDVRRGSSRGNTVS